jgi:hypothetical protein
LRALEAWSLCWAAAMLFSVTAAPDWFSLLVQRSATASPIHVALAGLAFLVILRPPQPWLLGLLAAVQLAHVAAALPEVPNHRLILTFVDLALLAALVGGRRGADLFDGFVPAARTIVVSLYAFAFFAKLNEDFLDPSSSCAAQFFGNVTRWWPMVPDGPALRRGVVWATLGAEGLLAGALCVRRLRAAAVIAGLVFHFLLALDTTKVFLNFSSVMFALLLLFLPRGFLDSLGSAVGRRSGLRSALGAGLLAIVLSGLFAASDWSARGNLYVWVRQIVWSIYALALTGYAIGWCLLEVRPEAALPRPRAAVMAVVALVWVNGLSPYLGLKTRTTFDMYSNLRLEADRSNHFLVPRSLDLFGFLGDRVAILETDDAALRRAYVETGEEMPYVQLRAYLTQHPHARVRYLRGGTQVHAEGTRDPLPYGLRKLLVFRSLGERSRKECVW